MKYIIPVVYKGCLLVSSFLLLFLSQPLITLVHAQAIAQARAGSVQGSSAQACVPIDLLFMIDRTSNAQRVDPSDIRIEAVRWIANFMGFDRIHNCAEVTHRLVIIDASGEELLPPTPMTPSPYSAPNLWENQLEQIFASVNTDQMPTRRLEDGFARAGTILQKLPPLPGPARKQVIVVIAADRGVPCTVDDACLLSRLQGSYYKDIVEDLSSKLTSTEQGPFVHALVYQQFDEDLEKYEQYAANLSTVTDAFRGKYTLIENSLDLVQELTAIFQNYNPNPELTRVAPGNFFVDPFLYMQDFYIFRIEKDELLGINPPQTAPGMRSLLPETPAPKGRVLTYVYLHPGPGEWNLLVSPVDLIYAQPVRLRDNGIDNLIEVTGLDKPLPQYPENDSPFDKNNPYFFSFRLVDNTRLPMEQVERFSAKVEGEVTNPAGKEYEMTFEYKGGVYTSNEPLPVNKEGTYTWKLEITADSASLTNRVTRTLVEDEGTYEVSRIIPVTPSIIAPIENVTLHGQPFSDKWMRVLPLKVQVRLGEAGVADGSGIAVSEALKNPGRSLSVTMIERGTNNKETIRLAPSPADPSVLEGWIGEGLNAGGEYVFDLDFEGEMNPCCRWIEPSQTVTMNRVDTIPTNPNTWITIAGLIALAILVALGLFIFYHTNPVHGQLAFYYCGGTQPFNLFPLSNKRQRYVTHNTEEKTDFPLLWFLKSFDVKIDNGSLVITLYSDQPDGKKQDVIVLDKGDHLSSKPAGDPLNNSDGHVYERSLGMGIYARFLRNKPQKTEQSDPV